LGRSGSLRRGENASQSPARLVTKGTSSDRPGDAGGKQRSRNKLIVRPEGRVRRVKKCIVNCNTYSSIDTQPQRKGAKGRSSRPVQEGGVGDLPTQGKGKDRSVMMYGGGGRESLGVTGNSTKHDQG